MRQSDAKASAFPSVPGTNSFLFEGALHGGRASLTCTLADASQPPLMGGMMATSSPAFSGTTDPRSRYSWLRLNTKRPSSSLSAGNCYVLWEWGCDPGLLM